MSHTPSKVLPPSHPAWSKRYFRITDGCPCVTIQACVCYKSADTLPVVPPGPNQDGVGKNVKFLTEHLPAAYRPLSTPTATGPSPGEWSKSSPLSITFTPERQSSCTPCPTEEASRDASTAPSSSGATRPDTSRWFESPLSYTSLPPSLSYSVKSSSGETSPIEPKKRSCRRAGPAGPEHADVHEGRLTAVYEQAPETILLRFARKAFAEGGPTIPFAQFADEDDDLGLENIYLMGEESDSELKEEKSLLDTYLNMLQDEDVELSWTA